MTWLLTIPVLLFSVIAHEVAHGYVAYRCGDPTAKYAGRLTFNPIPHIDLFGTIIFPTLLVITNSPFLIGWAKPVPVNSNNFRHPRRDDIYVSLAGITVNLGLAIICTVLYGAYIKIFSSAASEAVPIMLNYGIVINVFLAVFNLIPIPPLDGSWVLYHLLPVRFAEEFRKFFQYGFIVLILLVMTGIIYRIMMPIAGFVLSLLDIILQTISNI